MARRQHLDIHLLMHQLLAGLTDIAAADIKKSRDGQSPTGHRPEPAWLRDRPHERCCRRVPTQAGRRGSQLYKAQLSSPELSQSLPMLCRIALVSSGDFTWRLSAVDHC